jgi:YfiH family protein
MDVAFADAPRPLDMAHTQADIILTDKPGVTLMMRFADCVPILLYDPVCKVVGIAHAGWMGTVRGTASAAVEAMHGRFGSDPTDIQAAIGPSIGPDHYEIGPDVILQVRKAFGPETEELLVTQANSTFFNLWAANRKTLEKAGVRKIETAGICTACHTEDWFSHRAERGRTGRFGAMIALKNLLPAFGTQ